MENIYIDTNILYVILNNQSFGIGLIYMAVCRLWVFSWKCGYLRLQMQCGTLSWS